MPYDEASLAHPCSKLFNPRRAILGIAETRGRGAIPCWTALPSLPAWALAFLPPHLSIFAGGLHAADLDDRREDDKLLGNALFGEHASLKIMLRQDLGRRFADLCLISPLYFLIRHLGVFENRFRAVRQSEQVAAIREAFPGFLDDPDVSESSSSWGLYVYASILIALGRAGTQSDAGIAPKPIVANRVANVPSVLAVDPNSRDSA